MDLRLLEHRRLELLDMLSRRRLLPVMLSRRLLLDRLAVESMSSWPPYPKSSLLGIAVDVFMDSRRCCEARMDSRRCRRSLAVETGASPMVDKGMEDRRCLFFR